MKKYLVFIFFSFTITLKAQQGPVKAISSETLYPSFNYHEKIHVNLNSQFLLVGESLLFNITCINLLTNTTSDLSTIAYLEVINEDAIPVLQTRIELTNGLGYGDLFLPSTLTTGNYKLIAYTNWMRNYPTDFFFTTTITVINPFKKPAYQFILKPKEVDIEFYPEGGNILTGALNTIAYIIRNNTTKKLPYTVKIVDDIGNAITESISLTDEKGIFTLSPVKGRIYKAIVANPEFSFIKELSLAKSEGIGLHTIMSEENININLTYQGKYNGISAMLAIQHQGIDIYKFPIKFVNDTVNFKVGIKMLPVGFSRIRILNSAGQIECERTIFIKPPAQNHLSTYLEKKDFKKREKVSMSINLKDSLKSAQLSVSVRKIDRSISNTFLTEEIAVAKMSDIMIDFQCLTYHAKENNNSENNVNDLQNPKFLPEVRGLMITGIVKDLTDEPMVNDFVYLSIPSTNYQFLASRTDSSGNFYFLTNKIKYATDIILQVAPELRTKYHIEIKSEFLNDYSMFIPTSISIDSSLSELIKERSIFTQLENVYYSEKSDSVISNLVNNRFYGPPDKSYLLDNYVRFTTLDDIFIEYIPEVSLRKKDDQFNIKVVNYKTGAAFSEDPLVLLDGIPIFDHNKIISLNPLLIKKIEIIKRRYFYGPLDLNGIISLETYKGDGMNISFKDYIVKEITGIQPKKIYHQPNYSGKDLTRIPDFRIQLYWEPCLRVSSNQPGLVEFYTSDVSGEFEISIDGFDQEGNKISIKETITVN